MGYAETNVLRPHRPIPKNMQHLVILQSLWGHCAENISMREVSSGLIPGITTNIASDL
jgi:hypothetical protein